MSFAALLGAPDVRAETGAGVAEPAVTRPPSAAIDAARGDACRGAGGPVVRVAFTGSPWAAELRDGVLEHLRAGLGPTGFRVCDAGGAGDVGGVATVELRQNAGARVTATIEVRDGVTKKRVARDIDLAALPDDARALGVSVAADELLRASFIELSLTGAPAPEEPPPAEVRRAVETSLRVERPSGSELDVLGALEGYTGGLLLLGGDLAFRRSFGEWFAVGVALGLRQSGSEASPHGTVSATLLGAAGSVFVTVARVERLRVALEADLWAADVRLRGEPGRSAVGSEASALSVVARAGVELTYRIAGTVLVSARGGAGAPLRAVVARDYGETGAGVSGLEWFAAAGPGVAF